jgi:hypothetical protein
MGTVRKGSGEPRVLLVGTDSYPSSYLSGKTCFFACSHPVGTWPAASEESGSCLLSEGLKPKQMFIHKTLAAVSECHRQSLLPNHHTKVASAYPLGTPLKGHPPHTHR